PPPLHRHRAFEIDAPRYGRPCAETRGPTGARLLAGGGGVARASAPVHPLRRTHQPAGPHEMKIAVTEQELEEIPTGGLFGARHEGEHGLPVDIELRRRVTVPLACDSIDRFGSGGVDRDADVPIDRGRTRDQSVARTAGEGRSQPHEDAMRTEADRPI